MKYEGVTCYKVFINYLPKYCWDVIKVGVKRTSLHVGILGEHEGVVQGVIGIGDTVAHHATCC